MSSARILGILCWVNIIERLIAGFANPVEWIIASCYVWMFSLIKEWARVEYELPTTYRQG